MEDIKNVKTENQERQAGDALFLLCFYVPADHCERVKQALFDCGAGRVGHYDCCAWQTVGNGQFRPLYGSKPAIGELDRIERLEEYKVELVCDRSVLPQVLDALKEYHPYEEVAYHYIPVNPPL